MNKKLKKALIISLGVVGAAGVGIQFVPMDGIGNNPPERFALDAPPDVKAVLTKACLDCHSNETRWPWYSRIAPGSWLILRDVKKGRAHMNTSEWGDADESERALDKENSWELVEKGEMPPWFYLPMHPDARLTDAEKALLKSWFIPNKNAAPPTAPIAGRSPEAPKPAEAAVAPAVPGSNPVPPKVNEATVAPPH